LRSIGEGRWPLGDASKDDTTRVTTSQIAETAAKSTG
jgi:hypothetical protein